MNRFVLASLLTGSLATALAGCDKQGLYPYGRKTDVIVSCGDPASVYLSSTATGTEILIIGNIDPTTVVGNGTRRCMVVGTVDRDSSTRLVSGSYELDGSGRGEYYVDALYEFAYQPNLNIGARDGSSRTDTEYHDPIDLSAAGDTLTFEYLDEVRTYTAFDTVVANVDLGDPQGPTDLAQVYNLALFFSQVRIPAFGGLGMTRYITTAGSFNGLIGGDYSVSVKSAFDPIATIRYTALEDFPRIIVDGTQITNVNLSGDGQMDGVLSFSIRNTADPSIVAFAGTFDYDDIVIQNGIAAGGDFKITTTTPVATTTLLPYTIASNVDLTHVLPIAP